MECEKTDCKKEAEGVLGFRVYSNEGDMLTTLVVGLCLCEEHSHVTPAELFKPTLGRDPFGAMCDVVARSTGKFVALEKTEHVLLSFDSPLVNRILTARSMNDSGEAVVN